MERGYYPTITTTTGSGSDAIFAALFVQNKMAATEARFGLTGAHFDAKNCEGVTRDLSCIVIRRRLRPKECGDVGTGLGKYR